MLPGRPVRGQGTLGGRLSSLGVCGNTSVYQCLKSPQERLSGPGLYSCLLL